MENTTYTNEDQEIAGYIASTFTQECGQDLTTALSILYDLEYPNIQEFLVGLVNGAAGDDKDLVSMQFEAAIHDGLNDIFTQWGVTFNEEVRLSTKNTIASSMNFVQEIEDPVPYLRILETNLSPVEKLARIVEGVSDFTEIEVLDSVLSINPETLSRLYDVLTQAEERLTGSQEEPEINEKQLKCFTDFQKYCNNEPLIGYVMLVNNFLFGMKYETYLPYVEGHLVQTLPEETAKNLLSFFFLSSDTWEAPLETFRKESERLLHRGAAILPTEDAMRKILTGFEQYRKTINEPS